jgi:RNA polymerase sigma-70 factor, ECF subfamily
MEKSLGEAQPSQLPQPGPPMSADAQLVAAVLNKDRKATADFVARYADDVYGYIRSRLAPHYDQVDDLVQEVFLAAWQGLGNYRGSGPLQAWIMGIARHKVEDYYRGCLRAPGPIDDAEQYPPAAAPVLEFPELVEQEQLRENAWRVLESLPEHYRLALVWRYWEKVSTCEMALKTGKTEKAMERLLARARAEFRKRWNYGQPF